MNPIKKKDIAQFIKICVLALVLGLGVSAVYSWTDPISTPPGCADQFKPGCSAPLNTGIDGQIKLGGISLAYGLNSDEMSFSVLSGKVGIGVDWPDKMLEVAGFSKSRTGFCIKEDCITQWPTEGNGSITVDAPAGAVMPFNMSQCPSGWTVFTDAAGRAIIGVGNSGEPYAINHTLGQKNGNEKIIQGSGQMALHNHNVNNPYNLVNALGTESKNHCSGGDCTQNVNIPQDQPGTNTPYTGSTGGGQGMSIMNPFITLLYCIKS